MNDIQQLVAAAQSGDLEARDQLAKWILQMLGPYVEGQLPWQDADDVVQECYMVLFRKLPDF